MTADNSDPADSPPLLALLQQEWAHLLNQSLERIRHCVDQLTDEQIWWRPQSQLNSVGILIRHLAGNLTQWVVDGVTESENTRDRRAEFESSAMESREHLMKLLCQAVARAVAVIDSLQPEDMPAARRIQQFDVTVLGAIMHSVPHFVGHTHQIVQLTRLQTGESYRFHWTPDDDRGSVPV